MMKQPSQPLKMLSVLAAHEVVPMATHYSIKEGYRINTQPRLYNDSEEDALTFQLDVYRACA